MSKLHAGPFLALTLLSGCSSMDLSAEARRTIHAVSLSPTWDEKASFSGSLPELDVTTRGSIWYLYWITAPVGIVFDLIDWSRNAEARQAIYTTRLQGAKVAVGVMLRDSFQTHLEKGRSFPAVVDEDADAEFRFAIDHGISDGLGLRGTWKPWLEVDASLVERSSGRVVWRRKAAVGSNDARTPEVFNPFKNHDNLRDAYEAAIEIVTKDLLESLKSADTRKG
ncbi:MAG TPA: hypothetical protein VMT52_05425 [Planctomycetota bacterium]|nr:hypothetical protein [Planctomycetota bacterium]